MGTYRVLQTTLSCLRCGADYSADVQFKTGNDYSMPVYQVGDRVEDVSPAIYDGITDAYCAQCLSRWIDEENHVHFELLADQIAAGRLVARRATWRHGALDGRPELGLVVTIHDETPMTAEAVRALAEAPDQFTRPSIGARLHQGGVALWDGDLLVFPSSSDAVHWWQRRHEQVASRLRAAGWPGDGSAFVEIVVLVDTDHRVRLAPRS